MEAIDPKEKKEFIIFELIQDSLGIKDPLILKNYLTEVFKDLANTVDNQNKKFMTKMAFYDYIKLPIYITEKVFNSFSKLTSQGLCEEEFVENFFKLYKGSFEETITVIFNILDFDKDGIIKMEEVKILLSQLPINEDYEVEEVKFKKDKKENKKDSLAEIYEMQMKCLKEIDEILDNCFDKLDNKMNLEQFTKITIEKNSEIFLRILCYLYEQMPFSGQNIEAMETKFNQIKDEDLKTINAEYEPRAKKSGSICIKSSKRNTLLLPTGIFFKKFKISKFSMKEIKTYDDNEFKLSEQENQQNPSNEIKASDNNPILRKVSKSLSPENKKNNNICKEKEIKKNLDLNNNNTDNYTDIKNKSEKYNNIKIFVKNPKQDNTTITGKEENKIETKENNLINNKNNITYQNWVYKITESLKLRKFYLVLINKDIYYYKSETKKDFVGMHNLTGSFIQECTEKKRIQGKNFASFEIYSKNKSKVRKFLTENEFISKDFVYLIKRAIGYANFPDIYEKKELIGKGGFGEVYLGKNKKTKQQVAIKILKKENIKTVKDNESVRLEIDILKLCHHPNILRILDHFENYDYIYIVMEYIEGGTLFENLKKNNYHFKEKQAANIMKQIAKGVKYLHQYGIIHRDLKPENISITRQNNFDEIKIMDFGLSKILASTEKMVSYSGTLSYMAPEILKGKPHNKEIDIWSIGIIMYVIINGYMPFEGKTDKEIMESIKFDKLKFYRNKWGVLSNSAEDLIKRCLEKSPEKRISIDEFINHPWFKENNE